MENIFYYCVLNGERKRERTFWIEMDLKCNTFVDLSRLKMRRFWFTYIYFSHPKLNHLLPVLAIVQCFSLELNFNALAMIYFDNSMLNESSPLLNVIFDYFWRGRSTKRNDVYDCFPTNHTSFCVFPFFFRFYK